ncbi:MAG TPA: ferritin-like domain-containing protein [Kofleriaceae bacterium]|nr:ferritin-like domain-containing protein [Kofleriaceae bacterium]
MSSESYHEPVELLSEGTKNMHRALVSLREELEAVDWYQQRAEACSDAELSAVLVHNKNEEVEHAAMTLEWIRRNSPIFDQHLKTYLNTTGSILEVEAAATGGGEGGEPAGGPTTATASTSLGIGSLKGKR